MTTNTHRIITIGGTILLALALSAAIATAQSSGAPTSSASYVPPTDSMSGQSMLEQLMRAHREQIRISRAATASTNPEVRRFAQQMVDERTAALNSVIALSDRLGYTRGDTLTTLSATMTPADSGLGGGLSALASVEADRSYLAATASANEALLNVLSTRGSKVQDPTVRAMATETQSTIGRQLADARKLQGASSGATGQ